MLRAPGLLVSVAGSRESGRLTAQRETPCPKSPRDRLAGRSTQSYPIPLDGSTGKCYRYL